ncbi:MAG: hypothetical protein V4692_01485, partial [Bdellovibrionota bacterium]
PSMVNGTDVNGLNDGDPGYIPTPVPDWSTATYPDDAITGAPNNTSGTYYYFDQAAPIPGGIPQCNNGTVNDEDP